MDFYNESVLSSIRFNIFSDWYFSYWAAVWWKLFPTCKRLESSILSIHVPVKSQWWKSVYICFGAKHRVDFSMDSLLSQVEGPWYQGIFQKWHYCCNVGIWSSGCGYLSKKKGLWNGCGLDCYEIDFKMEVFEVPSWCFIHQASNFMKTMASITPGLGLGAPLKDPIDFVHL